MFCCYNVLISLPATDEWIRYTFNNDAGTAAPSTSSALPPGSSETTQLSAASSSSSSASGSGSSSVSSASAYKAKQRSTSRRNEDGEDEYSSAEDEELEIICSNPDKLDVTAEEIEEREREGSPPPPKQYPQPRSPDCPNIQVVESYTRNGRVLCRLADGRVVTEYDHAQLVQIGKNNQLFDSMGLFGMGDSILNSQGGSGEGEGTDQYRAQLPESFEMPPPRTQAPRGAKTSGNT